MVVVKREAIRNAMNGIYSSLMCVFALSSVTGMDLISVYPERLGKETKYSQFQNGTISPRARHDSFSSKLVQEAKIIMWTTGGVGVLTHNETFQPNHFVPLVEFTTKQKNTEGLATLNQQKIPWQRKITDLFQEVEKEPAATSEGNVFFIFNVRIVQWLVSGVGQYCSW